MRVLFWTGIVTMVYAYAGYPAWLCLRCRLWPKPIQRAPAFPQVSVVMVVRNEARTLPRKLANLAALNYPSDRIDFVVLSDGSSDGTLDLLRQQVQRHERLRVISCEESHGKARGLNDCISCAQGEIVLFTDARQQIEPDAVRLLVENFSDSSVGCASGELMLGDPARGESNQGTGLYWAIEKKIRRWESASGSVVGATGALYAARRALLGPIPAGTILDDLYLPMHVVRQGYRVVFDERARAWDIPNLGEKREFSRKVRTLNGNYQMLQLAPWLLGCSNPIRFEFVSHKLMRLLIPLALIVILFSSLLADGAFFRGLLILQLGFYALSLLGMSNTVRRGVLGRAMDTASTFVMLNAAASLAFVYWVAGRNVVWAQAGREVPSPLKTSEMP